MTSSLRERLLKFLKKLASSVVIAFALTAALLIGIPFIIYGIWVEDPSLFVNPSYWPWQRAWFIYD